MITLIPFLLSNGIKFLFKFGPFEVFLVLSHLIKFLYATKAAKSTKHSTTPSGQIMNKIYLSAFTVAEADRGKGIGETILKDIFRALPGCEISLNTNHQKLVKYYEKVGFELTTSSATPLKSGNIFNSFAMKRLT